MEDANLRSLDHISLGFHTAMLVRLLVACGGSLFFSFYHFSLGANNGLTTTSLEPFPDTILILIRSGYGLMDYKTHSKTNIFSQN